MPKPEFNQLGLLVEGIHDCEVMEAQKRFGSFQGSDRRPQLWTKFLDFVRLANAHRFIQKLPFWPKGRSSKTANCRRRLINMSSASKPRQHDRS